MSRPRALVAAQKAIDRSFDSEFWDINDAQASVIFDVSTTEGSRALLDAVSDGSDYADVMVADLTTRHSDQAHKNKFANTYIQLMVLEFNRLEHAEENAATLQAHAREIDEKAAAFDQMKKKEKLYGELIMIATETKGRLGCIQKVVQSLLDTQIELGERVNKDSKGLAKMTIAINCADSEWQAIQMRRRAIKKELEKDGKTEMKPFMAETMGKFGDGTPKRIRADVNKWQVRVLEGEKQVADGGEIVEGSIEVEGLLEKLAVTTDGIIERSVASTDAEKP